MKLIAGQPNKASSTLHYYIEQDGDEVVLKVQKPSGESYFVMSFGCDGTFHRCHCISTSLGLKLDKNGGIVER